MTTLPTGEKLPDYDDGPADGVDVAKMHAWIAARPGWYLGDPAPDVNMIRTVLAALQAVGDATLVKNATYRAMRKDGADIERLTAHLANRGHAGLLVECDGNPVAAIIAVATELDATEIGG